MNSDLIKKSHILEIANTLVVIPDTMAELMEAANNFDYNKDGRICVNEFRFVMRTLGNADKMND